MILCLGGLTGWEFLFLGTKGGLSAEGAKLRLPKARSPSRLGGLGERRMLPQRGLGGGRLWGVGAGGRRGAARVRSGGGGGRTRKKTDVILNISSPDGVHFK